MNPRGADTNSTCPGRNLICQVATWATVRAGGEDLVRLRRQPGTVRGLKLAASFLKHSDDHTVLELAAVLKAMARTDQTPDVYRDWGVVSGPRLFGRDSMAWVIARYRTEGAWGIPPHIIPHGTLHAASGTVSQALGMHGPNISVSGGPGACSEAILVAGTMLCEGNLPGLWLLLSAFDGEKLPEDPACAGMPCDAVALALSSNPSAGGATLRIALGDEVPPGLPEFSLPSFCAAVEGDRSGAARWRLSEGGWVEYQGG